MNCTSCNHRSITQLEGSSAWINLITGDDKVSAAGWSNPPEAES